MSYEDNLLFPPPAAPGSNGLLNRAANTRSTAVPEMLRRTDSSPQTAMARTKGPPVSTTRPILVAQYVRLTLASGARVGWLVGE